MPQLGFLRRSLVGAIFAAVWMFFAGWHATASGATLNLVGYHLSFDDEFNSFVWSPDGSKGWSTVWANRTVMGDQNYFSDSTVGVDPFSIGGGVLTITASPGPNPVGRPYNTGLIGTHESFRQAYGYFEMRAQMAQGAGMWPSFWLYSGTTVRELDIVEAFGAPRPDGGGSGSYHWGIHDSAFANGETGAWVQTGANIYTGYHSYGMLWDLTNITFYFDGREMGRAATPADMNVPMYILANLAVGGGWAGPANGATGQMKIDYIRVFSNDSGVKSVPLQIVSSPDGGGNDFYGAVVGQPTPPPVPPPSVTPSPDNTVIKAPSTGAIMDKSGNLWTITSGGQVAVNGTPDLTTQGVVELAWESGVIWQKNTWENWYSTTAPTAGWQGPTKTSPVPGVTVSKDTLSLILSEDRVMWQHARFIIKVDGVQIGGPTAVTASHSLGKTQQFDFTGHWAPGTHQIQIDFVNDSSGGNPRNLYVKSVLYNGASILASEVSMHGHPSLVLSVTDQTP